MRTSWFLLVVSACAAPASVELGDRRRTDDSTTATPRDRDEAGKSAPASSVPVVTNSPEGQAFYTANVHPFMAQKCGACHASAGPGPSWFTPADAAISYKQLFA